MEKLNTFLNKYLLWTIWLLLVVSLLNACNGCNSARRDASIRKDVDRLDSAVTTLSAKSYDKDELDTRISIEGYEISKRMLYDQNAIVRTTVRPDDRMNEYDGKIKTLREKLNTSK